MGPWAIFPIGATEIPLDRRNLSRVGIGVSNIVEQIRGLHGAPGPDISLINIYKI